MKYQAGMDIRSGKYLGDYSTDNPEWHRIRLNGISGTDAGTILGLNPWESAYTLYHKKTGQISSDIEQNDAMRLGQILEDPLLQFFSEKHPDLTIFRVGTFCKSDEPWMIANPDAIAFDEEGNLIIVEIKTARKIWDSVPPHYTAQVLHYADVFSADKAIVVAHHAGQYGEFEIDIDPYSLEAQRTATKAFYEQCMGEGVAPDWDGSQSTYETARSLYPTIEDSSVELGPIGDALINAVEAAEGAEKVARAIKSEVLEMMQENKFGLYDGKVITVRQQRGEGKPYLTIRKDK